MFKRILSLCLVLITMLSVMSIAGFAASAEELANTVATADEATKDEATSDEAKLVITDTPDVPSYMVNGMAIGYIGDANKDDKINVKDATFVQKYLAKMVNFTESQKLLADADNNQKLNVRDATTIQKFIAGFELETKIRHLIYETGTHKHNFVGIVCEPDCVNKGFTRYSCICSEEYTDEESIVPAKGHNYTRSEVKASCVQEGYTIYTCLNCNHSYKDNVKPATGEHNYNNKNICTACGMKKDAFDILWQYLYDNGEYDDSHSSFVVALETGYDDDKAYVSFDELEGEIKIGYSIRVEDTIAYAEVIITQESPYFRSFAMYPGMFTASSSNNSRESWSLESDTLNNLNCYYYNEWEEIPEDECMAFSIILLDSALAVYYYNEDVLPVTLSDLGFSSFSIE